MKNIPLYVGNLGWAFGCSRMGVSHKHGKTPCQDAYTIWYGSVAGEPYLVMAVADGHGAKKHDLSQYGSHLAVKAALDELHSFHFHFKHIDLKQNFRDHFSRRVEKKWREIVKRDASERFSDKAYNDQPLFTRYGTTLLVGLITPDTMLFGRIGDGDIIVVEPGSEPLQLFKDDTSLVGNETHSLSSDGSSRLWQTTTISDLQGGLVLMGTDGLRNSLVEGELNKFALEIVSRVKEFGAEKIANQLPNWLDHYSEEGSRDDMTLGLVWIEPRANESISGK